MQPQIYECRWNWCGEIFSNNATRVHHFKTVHLPNITPVSRNEIARQRKLELGPGKPTISLSLLVSSYWLPVTDTVRDQLLKETTQLLQ
jgi:hypothetical protein